MLIIDTPKSCLDCPLYYEDDMLRDFCKAVSGSKGYLRVWGAKPRPIWCPLKRVPGENARTSVLEDNGDDRDWEGTFSGGGFLGYNKMES